MGKNIVIPRMTGESNPRKDTDWLYDKKMCSDWEWLTSVLPHLIKMQAGHANPPQEIDVS